MSASRPERAQEHCSMIEDKIAAQTQSKAFLLAMVALGACLVSFAGLTYTQRDRARWVAHGREVARVARELRAITAERQAGILHFLFLRDSTTIVNEVALRAPMMAYLDRLDSLTTDNPGQQARARRIRARVSEWERSFGIPAARRATGLDTPASRATDARYGETLFGALRVEVTAFLEAEELLYDARVKAEMWVQRVLVTTLPLEVITLAVLLIAFRRRLAEQTMRIVAQKDAISGRNAQLALQTAQLGHQNEELHVQTEDLQTQAVMLEEQTAELEVSLEELRGSEERFRTLVASMPDIISTMDSDGRIDSLLGGWVERENVDPTLLLGRTVTERLGEVRGAIHLAANAKALSGEQVVYDWNTPPGESQRFFTTSLSPLRDRKNGVTGIVSVSREITQRHRQQAELETTLDRLRHAQKLEAIGQLAGGVAHDFNNILTIILAYSDMLALDLAPDARAREPLEEIRLAATRAAGVTRQLLSFSRRQELHQRLVNVNEVVSGVQKLIERLAGPEVALHINLDPDIHDVMADPGQLEQVIMNLAVNARDAMPSGGALTIETEQMEIIDQLSLPEAPDGAGSFVVLRVRDAGSGMSDDTKARLFEPFFTTKDVGKGTGLGLATVYGIVEQAKGQIRVESALGRGSTFTIYLPSGEGQRAGEQRIARMSSASSERILLVDDDESVRTATARLLRGLGYDVIEASNAREALHMLDEGRGRIQTVVTDMVMPLMSGADLAHEIGLRFPECAVVIVSGYLRVGSVDEELRDRVVFVEKPFTLETITAGVREAQRRREFV